MTDVSARSISDPITEKLLESLVALAAEVSVLRDRVAALEARAEGNSLPASAESAEHFVTAVFGGMASMAPRTGADT
ncbi:hypothetical protein ANTHELSMS3_04615 (plasmid) [Antarctobacter heliothermus]|uniref:Uncharacterized protein n=1 Tax=Antarctobacter heliothermus TaxID=74033 RepID=A0A222EBZ2_9RHOB|nr:hypothetical protein [Antarctobacter heliothermus]ASP23716.1 hypothetical protein ANTHELSMS3_04615 [Antarctobacter heliothermus]